jgi:hypothetical protein
MYRVEQLFNEFKKARSEFEKYLDQNSAIKACEAFDAYKGERDGKLMTTNYRKKWNETQKNF